MGDDYYVLADEELEEILDPSSEWVVSDKKQKAPGFREITLDFEEEGNAERHEGFNDASLRRNALVQLEMLTPSRYDNVLQRISSHMLMQFFIVVLILFDLTVLLIDVLVVIVCFIIGVGYPLPYEIVVLVITYIILALFMAELLLRMLAFRLHFFISILNWFDLIIVVLSIVLLTVLIIVDLLLRYFTPYAITNKAIPIGILAILRFIRVIRIFILIISRRRTILKASRHKISENKRRYVKDGFDLDLTFVTERIIAMSVPAVKLEKYYRNPVSQVVKFFNKTHEDHYRIYNVCPERKYPEDGFTGDIVKYYVEDHNPPTIPIMIEFCYNVENWLGADSRNIIAVHCKGGKGRTGSMICAWLLYSGICDKPDEALDYFARRRTDVQLSSKYQGVETRSQVRYIRYFRQVIEAGMELDEVLLYITRIDIFEIPLKSYEQVLLRVEVGYDEKHVEKVEVAHLDFCDVFTFPDLSIPVEGDVRVSILDVEDVKKAEKKGKRAKPFLYCWFNTSMEGKGKFILGKSELDKYSKNKNAPPSSRLEISLS